MTPEGVNIKHPDKLFIGGEWVAATSGRQIEVVSPNSEEVVARVAEAGPDDMDRAVAAAREAFDHGPWPTTPPAERGAKLMEMIDLPRSARARARRRRGPRKSAASPASRRSCTAAASPGCAGSPRSARASPGSTSARAWWSTPR